MRKPKTRLDINIEKARQAREVLKSNELFQQAVFGFRDYWKLIGSDEREASLDNFPVIKAVAIREGKPLPLPSLSRHYIKKGTRQYKDVLKILKKFNLSEYYWVDSISHYILYDKFPSFHTADTAEVEPQIIEMEDPTSNLPIVYLRLGKNTTLDDIKDSWSLIRPTLTNEEDDSIRRRHNPPKNSARDADIFKWSKNHTNDEIREAVRIKYKEVLDPGHIKKIVSSKKKELGIKDHPKFKTSRIKVRHN